jgi:hypothetical protein
MQRFLLVAAAVGIGSGDVAMAQPTTPTIQYDMVIEGLASKQVTIPVESWSWGASLENGSSDELEPEAKTSKQSKPALNTQDFNVVLKNTPVAAMLLEAMTKRKTLPKVSVHLRQPAGDEGFSFVLQNVSISSFQTGGSGYGAEGPMNQISLEFKKAKLTIASRGASHTVSIDTGKK